MCAFKQTNTYRHYDPYSQKFFSEDPIGFMSDSNFYRYVTNNPLIRRDPTGLDACINSQLWHTVVVVDNPAGGKTSIDFYPTESQAKGLIMPVDAIVDISEGEAPLSFQVPGTCSKQTKAEDQALIDRAKELQSLAKKGVLKFNAFGAYPGTMNCWMFSGAVK